jgi:hypothetical protein
MMQPLHYEPVSSAPTPFFHQRLLLVSDAAGQGNQIRRRLQEAGFAVDFVASYRGAESAWRPGYHSYVLFDVSTPEAIEAAIETALRMQCADPQQRVGYLADPALKIWGLAGKQLAARSGRTLSEVLREFLATGLDGVVLTPATEILSEMCA